MAQSATPTTDVSPAIRPAAAPEPPQQSANVRRREQQRLDYDAWLREYHRWVEKGCCGEKFRGEIEWGGEADRG